MVGSTKFDGLELVNIFKSIIFRFKDQKYLHLLLHQEKANFYNIHQGNMTNIDYLEKFKNLLDMESILKGQLNDQYIVDIVTEDKHQG